MKQTFEEYAHYHSNARVGIDSSSYAKAAFIDLVTFVKLCREGGIVRDPLSARSSATEEGLLSGAEAELAFARAKANGPKPSRTLNFDQFEAALCILAEKRAAGDQDETSSDACYDELVATILHAHCRAPPPTSALWSGPVRHAVASEHAVRRHRGLHHLCPSEYRHLVPVTR